MSKTAFIFPGQGAQTAGMGKDFYENSRKAKDIFDMASELLSLDMRKLCFEKNDLLDKTEYTQAALVTVSMAAEHVLREWGMTADVTAGLSLGEYCAAASAGAFSTEDAVLMVRKRGIFMEEAVPANKGAMAAVIGLTGARTEEVLEKIPNVWIANYNCPGQLVITGEKSAVETAGSSLKEAGAKRVILLNVSGPFHSPMLEGAGKKLAEVLKTVTVQAPVTPYVTNVTAEYVTEEEAIKELLAKQVASSVLWQQSVERMIADGVDTFVEIGPGKTLTGFLRKIDCSVKGFSIEKPEDLEKVLESRGNR